LVEVLGQTLLGVGLCDEDPAPVDGVDPRPLPNHAIPAHVAQPSPDNNADNEIQDAENNEDGWGQWAMGNEQHPQQMEELEEPNVALNELMYAIQQEELVEDNQQLAPANSSVITFASVSSNESDSNNSVNHDALGPVMGMLAQAQVHEGDHIQDVGLLPFGEGIHNLLLAYPDDEEAEEDIGLEIDQVAAQNVNEMNNEVEQDSNMDWENNLLLPDNIQMVPPEEAHLQLQP
jgi:hypothetical protein